MSSANYRLTEITRNEVQRMGYEFVDLKYGRRGRAWYVQVFADKEGGITLQDCEKISRELGYELDRHPELLKQSYILEVSSPGLDRVLKSEDDFKKFVTKDFSVKLYEPIEGSRTYKGKILEVKEGDITFEDIQGKQRTVRIENIAKANLEVKLNES